MSRPAHHSSWKRVDQRCAIRRRSVLKFPESGGRTKCQPRGRPQPPQKGSDTEICKRTAAHGLCQQVRTRCRGCSRYVGSGSLRSRLFPSDARICALRSGAGFDRVDLRRKRSMGKTLAILFALIPAVGGCPSGNKNQQRAAGEQPVKEPRPEDAIPVVAEFMFRTGAAHDLLSCDSKRTPVLVVSLDSSRVDGLRGRYIRVSGPIERRIEIVSDVNAELQSPIFVEGKSAKGSDTVAVEMFGSGLCGGLAAIADRNSRSTGWVPRRKEPPLPPDKWECRYDRDCRSNRICVMSWKEWNEGAGIWRGSVGICVRGKHCASSQDCEKHERCDGADVVSSLDNRPGRGWCRPLKAE